MNQRHRLRRASTSAVGCLGRMSVVTTVHARCVCLWDPLLVCVGSVNAICRRVRDSSRLRLTFRNQALSFNLSNFLVILHVREAGLSAMPLTEYPVGLACRRGLGVLLVSLSECVRAPRESTHHPSCQRGWQLLSLIGPVQSAFARPSSGRVTPRGGPRGPAA